MFKSKKVISGLVRIWEMGSKKEGRGKKKCGDGAQNLRVWSSQGAADKNNQGLEGYFGNVRGYRLLVTQFEM